MKTNLFGLFALVFGLATVGCSAQPKTPNPETTAMPESPSPSTETTERVSFGGGCFWCIEAVFQRHDGVVGVTSGYQGGNTENPTYRDICTGTTGHAEVVLVEYDPAQVSFGDLLDLFWQAHDPTTLNRQGPDKGTQYRSVIYAYTEAQLAEAKASKEALDASKKLADPVVTEIAKAPPFYPAEDYHQDYYNNNRRAPYCSYNITPKLKKLGMDP